jgi:hypothetical protein
MGSRKIVVQGKEFRWKADIRGWDGQRIVHLRAWQVRAGSTLIAYLVGKHFTPEFYADTAYPTPKDARLMIEHGMSRGWKADERGANMYLGSTDEITFDDLRLVDLPEQNTG